MLESIPRIYWCRCVLDKTRYTLDFYIGNIRKLHSLVTKEKCPYFLKQSAYGNQEEK